MKRPLTHKDMYDKDGKCILPYGGLPKSCSRSKYIPAKEDEKHRKTGGSK